MSVFRHHKSRPTTIRGLIMRRGGCNGWCAPKDDACECGLARYAHSTRNATDASRLATHPAPSPEAPRSPDFASPAHGFEF